MKNKALLEVLAAAAVFVLVLAVAVINLRNREPENAEEKFVRLCAPVWDAAFEELASSGGVAKRGDPMPAALLKVFEKDRQLEEISMTDEDTVRFWFTLSSGGEFEDYIVYQRNDDPRQIGAVNQILAWRDSYNEPVEIEETDGSFKVTGFGVGKAGYINITRISTCWFAVKGYYPT